MPKVRETRKQKARELLRLAAEGPGFLYHPPDWPFEEKPKESYKLWSQSWLIPLIKELVPELREKPNPRPGQGPSHPTR